VPLCAACIDGQVEPAEQSDYPSIVRWARLPWLLGLLASIVLGSAAGASFAPSGSSFLLYGSVGAILAELLYTVVVFSRMHHAGLAAWRRELRAKLRLPDAPALSFVLYVAREPRFWTWRATLPFDGAFLAETPAGFLLYGERTRRVLRFEHATRISTERIHMTPWRTAVRVDLADGPRFLAFLEKETFRENRALALACAERARQRPPKAP
jgi:hypothetical protein